MKKCEILNKFHSYVLLNYTSEATVKCYVSTCRTFLNESFDCSVQNVSEDMLVEYLKRVKSVYSHSKYNQVLSVLKILYNKVLKQPHKLKNVKPIRITPKLQTLPNIHDVKDKIAIINNIKHRAILSTLLTTGLRINELLNIKISDVDSKSMRILVRNAKGGRHEFVLLTENLLTLLRAYYRLYKPSIFLFEGNGTKYSKTSVNRLIKCHVGDYSPHTMRHLAITYMVNKNTPMPKVKLFSRHKADSSVAFYYHYDENSYNELRGIMNEVA